MQTGSQIEERARCCMQQQGPAQMVAGVNAAQRSVPKIDWCKKKSSRGPHEIHHSDATEQISRENKGRTWCLTLVPGGCWIPAPSKCAARNSPGRPCGASRLLEGEGEDPHRPQMSVQEGSQPPPCNTPLPAGYSRLEISISLGGHMDGLTKC